MASIYYEVDGFTGQLPNGMASPSKGNHRVGMARLVWAATTIGTTPFGPRLQAGRALEVQWRGAMIRASIQPGPPYHRRSPRYARLDPSEKGAVSFFLGQAQAKLFAHDFFHVSRFVHYDSYLAYHGRWRRRTRPDFIGFYGKRVAIGVEAKGRSHWFDRTLVTNAKKQASSLPVIQGHPMSATYVHVACFYGDQWCAHLEDPPRQRRGQLIDPASLTLVYYLPIVNAIRTRAQRGPRGLEEVEGSYLTAYFAEVDLQLSVRADIAELVPGDDLAAPGGAGAMASLYDLVLGLDANEIDEGNRPSLQDDGRRFLGGDGIAVELGSSWADWDEPGIE
jgi:hypothetical protein